jgi:hypothetical protein
MKASDHMAIWFHQVWYTYYFDPHNWAFIAWKCNEMHKYKHTLIYNLFIPSVFIPLLFNFMKRSEYIFMTGLMSHTRIFKELTVSDTISNPEQVRV